MRNKRLMNRGIACGMLLAIWANSSQANLVGFWNFNEGGGQTAADSSPYGNNGTLGTTGGVDTSDPTWTASGGGHTGTVGDYALSFAGASKQRVTVLDSASLDIGSTGLSDAMTASAWVYFPSSPAATYDLLAKTPNNFPGNYEWQINQLQEGLGYNDAISGFHQPNVNAGPNLTIGAWHHVAVVMQETGGGSTIYTAYRDGAQYGSPVSQLGNFAQINTAALLIGLRGDGNLPFTGLIDDVAIWNEVLNDSQVAALTAGSSPFSVPEPSTVMLLAAGGLVLLRRKRVERIHGEW